MRQPLIKKAQKGLQTGYTATIPAPIGGWNAKDPEARMKPHYALWLENWWPGTADVSVRKGAVKLPNILEGNVQSLFAYSAPSGKKLFAATPSKLYDVTPGETSILSPMTITNGKFCYTHFTTVGGTFLLAVNGQDELQLFDGELWKSVNAASTPSITGIDTSEFNNICIFKRRVWFVKKNSTSAYYLPVSSIGGAAVEFPMGQLFSTGGHLVALTSWTIDGGAGIDDYLVGISSEGEVVVYRGIDPAEDFQLVGVFHVGEPIGRKCFIKYGGDVLLLTQIGLLPLSRVVQSSVIDRSKAVSNTIDYIFSRSASVYGAYYGWEGMVFAKENVLLVNIPILEGTSAHQYVMNTITNAWALFTGWDAFCWEILDEKLYFGGKGFVAQALVSNSDYGKAISSTVRTAYNYLGSIENKHYKLVRPLLSTSNEIALGITIDTDFTPVHADIYTVASVAEVQSYWDSAKWDIARWGDEATMQRDWLTIPNKEGFCASIRLRIVSRNIEVRWSATDILYQKGGVL